MPTPTKGARLGGSPAHERLLLANLATQLFQHGRITTTEAKARRLRPLAEKLITKAKRGDLHNRREVMRTVRDKDVVHKLFAEIGPHFAERPGGYTRIIKSMPRKGDNAQMAIIELVGEKTVTAEAEKARGTKFAKDAAKVDATTGAEVVDTTAEEAAETKAETTEDTKAEAEEAPKAENVTEVKAEDTEAKDAKSEK